MSRTLKEKGMEHVVLEAAGRIGESWRRRWDSLTLFTPAEFSGLPGLPFPGDPDRTPGKDEVADYLERYAAHFALPVRLATPVRSLRRADDRQGFVIECGTGVLYANQVVVATGPFQEPFRPAWSDAVDPSVTQLHSSEYRNVRQLPEGEVIVVGGGNSGVQLAAEIAAARPTSLSVGSRLHRLPERFLGRSIFWWLDRAGAMDIPVTSRLGQRASAKEVLIGSSPEMVSRRLGIRLLGRALGFEGGRMVTSDGARVRPRTVVWATGFRPNFRWIDVPVFGAAGRPIHTRGITPVDGLYFLGLPWLHTRGSALIGWVGRDAAYLSDAIIRRTNRSGRGLLLASAA